MTNGEGERVFLDTNILVYANIAEAPLHDANIVATMQAYGITQLLTHNEKDFDRFSSLISVQPLVP